MIDADPDRLVSLAEALAAEHAHLHVGDESPLPSSASCRHSALCLSGGGIRSASFALGVLQGLARQGVLNTFDYLSTVSGGGFAGGWLAAWRYRAHDQQTNAVLEALAGAVQVERQVEPEPLRRVRMLARYMNPEMGALSADSWTLATTILRNLLLNWVVLLPLLGAALLLPRVYKEAISAFYIPPDTTAAATWLAPTLVLFGSIVCLAVVLGFVALNLPSYGNRRCGQPQVLLWCHLPLCIGLIGLTAYWAMRPIAVTLADVMLVNVSGPTLTAIVAGSLVGSRRWRPRTWVAAAVGGAGSALAIWWLTTAFAGARVANPLYPLLAFPLLLTAVNFGIVLFVGIGSGEMGDADLEWYSRLGAWHLITAILWLAGCAIVFGAPALMHAVRHWVASRGGISDDAATPIVAMTTSALTAAAGMAFRVLSSGKPGAGTTWRRIALAAAAPALLVLLLCLLAWSNDELLSIMRMHSPIVSFVGPRSAPFPAHLLPEALVLFGVLVLLGVVMGRFVSPNKFSLHGMYRERLIRAFLGASRPVGERHANPFTGFDPADDLEMWQLSATRPLLVTNMTLNTIAQSSASGLHRKAEPFSATPLHVGAPAHGYRPAVSYAANASLGQRGMSLGTAMSISGAAASPNMGAFSSPAMTFLMAMFNARLGAWMGNPASTDGSWRNSEPRHTFRPLVDEMLGRTSDTTPYVYLSDGGHFDNLGLWQMVLRRCRYILVSDAGCDEDYTFADLANAIRQIRIDLGIPIVFDHGCAMDREHQGNGNPHCAVGRILYSAIDGPDATDGILIYVKATLSGDEPVDVLNFGRAHPSFPHESTTNQWFDEAHFESYRVLGFHSVMSIAAGFRQTDGLPGFFECAGQQDAARARGETLPVPRASVVRSF
jgi:hypothetical protein